MSFNFPS